MQPGPSLIGACAAFKAPGDYGDQKLYAFSVAAVVAEAMYG